MTRTTLSIAVIGSMIALAGCSHSARPQPEIAKVPDVSEVLPVSPAVPSAGANPTVGGAQMLPSLTIVQNAANAPNLSTLVAAVKAADLATTLSGPGPFTVFAPTNEAFGRLAPGTVDTLLKPENKPSLVKVLTYHVVAGNISGAQLMQRIAAGGGSATLTTVDGEPLTATMANGVIALTDVNGNKSYVETADVRQSNGVVHVVNGVLIPKLG
ncbi:fasciclin domain-containing protein [Sphingomonas bacterium]|uniref:fasciclin domain-containing protein n=1 Tax=Sphingomonas bacterium TaxID=1895847 RepID=UPI001575FA9A|nr:fasciclin domain-containing protein [Sphingomonas bacterium]